MAIVTKNGMDSLDLRHKVPRNSVGHLNLRAAVAEPPYDSIASKAIVDRALNWVGRSKYDNNGWRSSPEYFDCSKLVAFAVTGDYERHGISTGTITTMSCFALVTSPKPGDIANRDRGLPDDHCGIYFRDGLMIHAPDDTDNVTIGYVDSSYVFYRYTGGLV